MARNLGGMIAQGFKTPLHIAQRGAAARPLTSMRALTWALAVFLIALLLRVVQLDSVPVNLNPDEADNLTTYLLAKHTGYPTLLGFNWNGAPALDAYLIGWGWELSGQSMGGVRIMSALLTAASCGLFFALLYQVFRKMALALGLTALLMTNPWYLNFSRSGWENSWNTLGVLVIALGFFVLYQERQTRRGICLLVLGAVAGFYFYHPGKLFATAIFVLLMLGQLHPSYRVPIRAIGAFAVVTGLFILPQVGTMLCTKIAIQHQFPAMQELLSQPCTFVNQTLLRTPRREELPIKIQTDGWHRVSKVSVLAHDEPVPLLKEGLKKNLLGFLRFAREDFDAPLNKRYIPLDSPPIPLLVTVLYAIGLAIAVIKFPYVLLFYLLVLLPVQVLSMRTPDAARAVHIVPLIFFFAGSALDWLLELSKRHSQRITRWLYPLLVVTMIILAVHQSTIYWQWIRSEVVLKAREPAVARQEYQEWLQNVTERIQTANSGMPSSTSTSGKNKPGS